MPAMTCVIKKNYCDQMCHVCLRFVCKSATLPSELNILRGGMVHLDDPLMQIALEKAGEAYDADEVPVGAALFDAQGNLIVAERNRVRELNDPTAHAELLVIKKACAKLETTDLRSYTLVVTLEPCAMCAQGIAWAKVGSLRFGAFDVKSGGVYNGARVLDSKACHHRPEILAGIMEGVCGELLRKFFKEKRHVGA